MNCIINAAMDICAMSSIASEEDLVELLSTIRCQFEVVDECAEEDRGQLLEVLEHALALARNDAMAALVEAQAGFPLSRGSIARWIQRRYGYEESAC